MSVKNRIARKKARDLLIEIGYSSPENISLDELIWYCDGILKEEVLKNCFGRIVFGDSKSIITIDTRLDFQPKKNFVKAHEIGHLLLHKGIKKEFSETDSTITHWLAKGGHETEANIFAAELLMPQDLFSEKVAGKKLEITLIEEICNYFNVSKTAFFIRYVKLGAYPIAVVYSEKGIVKWVSITEDFVLQFIKVGTKIPYNTVTRDILDGVLPPKEPEIVNAIDWFPEDFELSRYKKWKFKELCFQTGDESILTCIWEI